MIKAIYTIYLKTPYEVKYQMLINKCKSGLLKHFNGSKAFTEYSNDMDNIYIERL